MRKLVRPPSPSCLATNAANWTQKFVSARQQDPKYKFSWPNQNCYQAIRQELSKMTHAHCAFCDGGIGTESRKTIEHFRPKSQFPELAYHWDNLFPCCDVCQSTKGEKFSTDLLKPDEADYKFDDYFIANYKTGALEPSPHVDQIMQQRAKITIQLYGLNSPERNKARLREFEHFNCHLTAVIDDYNYRFFIKTEARQRTPT